MKGNTQFDVNYMRRPGQRVVSRPKNGQQTDHQMMNETALGSKLKLHPRNLNKFNFQIACVAAISFPLGGEIDLASKGGVRGKKNMAAVWDLTNHRAGFEIWTNQKAVFGSRDRLDRDGFFEVWWVEHARSEPEMTSAEMTTDTGSEVKARFI